MAVFICKTKEKSYLVDHNAYGWQAIIECCEKLKLSVHEVSAKPINRFVTIYGEYIDLDGGDITDKRPIMFSKRENGKIISYAKEYGLDDDVIVYPI